MRFIVSSSGTFQSLADDWTRHKFKEYAPYLGLFLI